MDWLNLHIGTTIRSPEYVGSSPAERGTWLSVIAYACEIECGGIIVGSALWKDRQWQQACGVTMREVRSSARLLRVVGDDVHVNGYPVDRETKVKHNRKRGGIGGMARWQKERAKKAKEIADATSQTDSKKPSTLLASAYTEQEQEQEQEQEREDARAEPLSRSVLTAAPLDLPERLRETWREAALAHGAEIASRALEASRRLFSRMPTPAQMLETLKCAAEAGALGQDPSVWPDFRQHMRRERLGTASSAPSAISPEKQAEIDRLDARMILTRNDL